MAILPIQCKERKKFISWQITPSELFLLFASSNEITELSAARTALRDKSTFLQFQGDEHLGMLLLRPCMFLLQKQRKKRRGREDFGSAEILFFSASILSRWKTKQLRIPKTLLRHLNLLSFYAGIMGILYKTFLSFVSCRFNGQWWQSSSLCSVF